MAKAKTKFEAAGPSVPAELPPIRVGTRAFTYTSPSAIPPRTAEERRARGCEEETYRTKSGPKTKFTGRLKSGKPDTYCKPTSKPCEDRSSCPVQLVWLEGRPHLRFCVTPDHPGHVVGVESAHDAQALAKKACANWPNPKRKVQWPSRYFEKKAPEVVERSRLEQPNSPWGAPGLGQDDSPWMTEARSYQTPPTFSGFLMQVLPWTAVAAAAWLLTRKPAGATP